MEELLTEAQAHRIVLFFSALWLLSALCAAVFFLFQKKNAAQQRFQRAAGALYLAAGGPYLFLLWKIYNAIEDTFGLDSVKALFLNIILFIFAGVLAGLGWVRLLRRKTPPTAS